MKIDWIGSPNFDTNRKPIDRIVIHWFGVGKLNGADATFQKAGGTSAHYAIEDKTVHQYVKEEHVAYHAGNYAMNQRSIGIEHSAEPNRPASEDTYNSSAQLVAQICKKYNIPLDRTHIIRHSEVPRSTQCPGTMDVDKIISLAKAHGTTPEPEPTQPPMDDNESTMRLRAKSAADKILIDLRDRKLANKEGNVYVTDAASEVWLLDSNDAEKYIGLLRVIVRDYDLLKKDVATFDQKLQDKDKVVSTQSQQLLNLRDEIAGLTVRAEIAEKDAAKKEELRAKYYEQVKHLEGSLKTSNENAAYWQRKYNSSKPVEKYTKKQLIMELIKRLG